MHPLPGGSRGVLVRSAGGRSIRCGIWSGGGWIFLGVVVFVGSVVTVVGRRFVRRRWVSWWSVLRSSRHRRPLNLRSVRRWWAWRVMVVVMTPYRVVLVGVSSSGCVPGGRTSKGSLGISWRWSSWSRSTVGIVRVHLLVRVLLREWRALRRVSVRWRWRISIGRYTVRVLADHGNDGVRLQ
jgi:hypothetical protein